MNVKITCLSIDCPERKSLCCGAVSEAEEGHPGYFVCSQCGEPFVGGECTYYDRFTKCEVCLAHYLTTENHVCDPLMKALVALKKEKNI